MSSWLAWARALPQRPTARAAALLLAAWWTVQRVRARTERLRAAKRLKDPRTLNGPFHAALFSLLFRKSPSLR
jgi:hypothetical protein